GSVGCWCASSSSASARGNPAEGRVTQMAASRSSIKTLACLVRYCHRYLEQDHVLANDQSLSGLSSQSATTATPGSIAPANPQTPSGARLALNRRLMRRSVLVPWLAAVGAGALVLSPAPA